MAIDVAGAADSGPGTDEEQAGGPTAAVHGRDVRPFDFRRPNKLSRDHVRNLQIIHETFAGQFSMVLSSSLRVISTVTVEQIGELTYEEYVRDLPTTAHLSLLSMEPLPGVALLDLPVTTALVWVDLLLGGQGRPVPDRPLTEIEVHLVRGVLERALSDLADAFEPVRALTPEVVGHESNPQFAQIAAPSDMVVVVTLELTLATGTELEPTRATFCYPYTLLQPILDDVAGSTEPHVRRSAVAEETRARVGTRLQVAPVELRVEFAPLRMSSRDILRLRPGDLLPLPHPADRPLTATVGGVTLFDVEPVRRGKRVAARVTARRVGGDTSAPALTSGPTPSLPEELHP